MIPSPALQECPQESFVRKDCALVSWKDFAAGPRRNQVMG